MIYAYNEYSESAKALANELGVKRIKHTNSKFKGSGDKTIINWGATKLPDEVMKCEVINNPVKVKIASNKLTFFNTVKDHINIPEYTEDVDVARQWVVDGGIAVARYKLNGHSAQGIELMETVEMFNSKTDMLGVAPLYVKYIPKKEEYRVHIVNAQVIDVRRKALKIGVNKKGVNWKIRNHAGGFIFQKEGFQVDEKVIDESVKTVLVCGLDFGAVDVIWNNFQQKAYVLEVNTAPGLEGSTITNYKEGFEKFYKKDFNKVSLVADFDSDMLLKVIDEANVVEPKQLVPMWVDEAIEDEEF